MSANPYLILIAEADKKWFDWLEKAMEKGGYKYIRATNSDDVFKLCRKKSPNLLIIEHKLEEMDGVEVTTEIRDDPDLHKLPIVLFSDQNDKYTQLAAFGAGADYFITKGIKTKLFLARIGALLRRSYELTDSTAPVMQFGEITIDEEQYRVTRSGSPVELSKKEFQLLALLASKPGKVFKRPHILNRIWGDDIIVGDRNIDTHIKKLRKKIGKVYIKTARGVGYKFIPPDAS